MFCLEVYIILIVFGVRDTVKQKIEEIGIIGVKPSRYNETHLEYAVKVPLQI